MSDVLDDQSQMLESLQKQVKTLRAEMTILRQSSEDALEAFNGYRAPDYNEEFGMIFQSVEGLSNEVRRLQLSRLINKPDEIIHEVQRAGEATQQLKRLDELEKKLKDTARKMEQHMASASKTAFYLMCFVGGVGFLVIIVMLGEIAKAI